MRSALERMAQKPLNSRFSDINIGYIVDNENPKTDKEIDDQIKKMGKDTGFKVTMKKLDGPPPEVTALRE